MIDLVLPDTGRQFIGDNLDGLALEVIRMDFDGLGPAHFLIEARQTETALLALGGATLAFDDDRVQVNAFLVALFGVAAGVHGEDLIGQNHLRPRQTDAARLVHEIQHLAGVQLHLLVDRRQRLGLAAQSRMRIVNDSHPDLPGNKQPRAELLYYKRLSKAPNRRMSSAPPSLSFWRS